MRDISLLCFLWYFEKNDKDLGPSTGVQGNHFKIMGFSHLKEIALMT